MDNFHILVSSEILKSAFQYLSWPLIAMALILIFKIPLAKMISNIRFFKAGSLEIDFGEKLLNQGFTDEQLKIVKNLTANEIDLFLLVSYTNAPNFHYSTGAGLSNKDFRVMMLKLNEAGLIAITKDDGMGNDLFHTTTQIGLRTRAMIVNGTISLLHANT